MNEANSGERVTAPQQTVSASEFAICETHEKRLRGKTSCCVCEWLSDIHSQYVDELLEERRILRRDLLIARIVLIAVFIGIAIGMVVKR